MEKRFVGLLLVVLLGCSYVPSTRLEYELRSPAAMATSQFALAVERLREDRPPRYWASYQGRLFLTYIPLLPWIKIPYERPEESYLKGRNIPEPWNDHEEHFTRKISQAIARDLASSRMFREVRFVDQGVPSSGAGLVLGGELRSSEFDVYVSSYLLGVPGVLLWLLPIPIGRNAATVEIELELRKTDGTVVWSERASGRAGKLFWLYSPNARVTGRFGLQIYRYRRNGHGIDRNSLWAYHADAVRRAMEGVRPSLRVALSALEAAERP